MRKSANGFTIVELLIVIVVIAILATVTLIAFNGVQARARDSARYSDVKTIIKALELYKVDKGTYPPTSATVNPQATCAGIGTGYSYSWDSAGAWLKPLVNGGYLPRAPLPPVNDCSHYYRYYKGSSTTWGCTTLTGGWYLLQVTGANGSAVPSESKTFKPCPESIITATASPTNWVFSGYDN